MHMCKYVCMYVSIYVFNNCVCMHVCKGEKLKVKFAVDQATKGQRGSRGIDLIFLYPRR
jgi:hypothetical protein